MALCYRCNVETFVHSDGIPVCVRCLDLKNSKRKPSQMELGIRTILVRRMVEAAARLSDATGTFMAVTNEIPSGLPHPDGIQRIQNAARELAVARKKVAEADAHLNDYLNRGIVPEDLKQTG